MNNDVLPDRGESIAPENAEKILDLVKDRLKLLSNFDYLTHYFFKKPQIDRGLLQEFGGERVDAILTGFSEVFGCIDKEKWDVPTLDRLCHKFIEEQGYKPKEAFMTLRATVTGEKATPPLFDILAVLGKEEVLKRLE